jgi:hypothetical protein
MVAGLAFVDQFGGGTVFHALQCAADICNIQDPVVTGLSGRCKTYASLANSVFDWTLSR